MTAASLIVGERTVDVGQATVVRDPAASSSAEGRSDVARNQAVLDREGAIVVKSAAEGDLDAVGAVVGDCAVVKH